MQLKSGQCLKGNEYEIIRTLGQGGFGITYLAWQNSLGRKVAIKEFFMKDFCNRTADTGIVSVPSLGSKELVSSFQAKFLKEAQMIATLNHPNIVKIIDVFEENETAYYVMLYLEGGSLADLCAGGHRLSVDEALAYIKQLASALDYLHHRPEPMNHLDVKPANVLLDENGVAVLVDFGISKRYDERGGQTSSTPVGISHGYSPLEQYKEGGVKDFSPTTDIYSLGATLFKLLTGQTPPQASDILESGLPVTPYTPYYIRKAIESAMAPRRTERPQTIADFLRLLDGNSIAPINSNGTDTTIIIKKPSTPTPTHGDTGSATSKKSVPIWVWIVLGLVLIVSVLLFFVINTNRKLTIENSEIVDSDIPQVTTSAKTDAKEADKSDAQFGSIQVSSTPAGATIFLDGTATKHKSPATLEQVAVGSHNVKLVFEGFEDSSTSVSVKVGIRSELSFSLVPKTQKESKVDNTQTSTNQQPQMSATSAPIEYSPLKVEGPELVSVNDTFSVVFSANTRVIADFDWPGSEHFDVVEGPQKGLLSSTTIVNGKRTTTYKAKITYSLTPKQSGIFTLPSANANIDNFKATSPPLRIRVESTISNDNEDNVISSALVDEKPKF